MPDRIQLSSLRIAPPLVWTLVLAVTALLPAPANAQCCEDWDEPYICDLRFEAADQGTITRVDRASREGDWSVRLAPGQTLPVDITAVDQYGRSFPEEEIRYQLDEGTCGSLIDVESVSSERIVFRAGKRSGECRLRLAIPGNRNLDAHFDIVVSSRRPAATPPAAIADDASVIVAQRLYQAVLGRQASREEIAELARIVERGQAEDWVRAAFRSEEFTRQSGRLGADRLFERFYEGLLRRSPDASGARTYQPLMRRGDYAEVITSLLESSEFQKSVRDESMR